MHLLQSLKPSVDSNPKTKAEIKSKRCLEMNLAPGDYIGILFLDNSTKEICYIYILPFLQNLKEISRGIFFLWTLQQHIYEARVIDPAESSGEFLDWDWT